MTRSALLLAALFLTTPAAAEVLRIAPVYGQLVGFTLPEGFQDAYEHVDGPSYIHETVPAGETVNGWSQMITLTGAQGRLRGDAEDAAVAFAQQLADGYYGACPDSFAVEQLPAPQVAGAQARFAFYVGCGTVTGAAFAESMVALVIAGRDDIYTRQWAERGPAGGTAAFDPDRWLPRLDFLGAGTRVCDDLGEAPPYPSCGR